MVWITRALQAAVAISAWRSGYPLMALWMAASTLQSAALVVWGWAAWRWSEPVVALTCVAAVLEVYLRLVRSIRRPGFAGVVLILSGATAGFLVAWPGQEVSRGLPAAHAAVMAGKRVAMVTMAAALLGPWLFHPVRHALPPRTGWVARVTLGYLILFAALYWSISAVETRSGAHLFNSATTLGWAACLCGWLWALRLSDSDPGAPRRDDDLAGYARKLRNLADEAARD